MMSTCRILIALPSHGKFGLTGRNAGFYLSEAAYLRKAFTDAGYTVDLVSVQGGRPPMDGIDPSDPVQQAFHDDPQMSAKLANTPRPDQVNFADYDVILYAGGHGTMCDFPDSTSLAEIARDIYQSNGVVAAVCYGPTGLVNIILSDGWYLVDGTRSRHSRTTKKPPSASRRGPFQLQTQFEQRGAKHSSAPNFQPWVVRDGRLVTGQNPASATGVAAQVLTILDHEIGHRLS